MASNTSSHAQAVIISTDQTTTQNLDTLAGGNPGTDAQVNPGVTVNTTNPPGSGGNGIFGSSRAWVVTNDGFITGQTLGINLAAGGEVNNSAGATITGLTREGLRIRNAPGTVNNSGIILGSREGVFLQGGGSVTNNAGGSITSNTREAIQIQGGSGLVINGGDILGRTEAVILLGGGSVTNNAGGSIMSITREAIQIQGGTGTVDNSGTIVSRLESVLLLGGGSVTNNVGGSITSNIREAIQIQNGVGTVDNSGTILGRSEAVFLLRGGSVTNNAGASITSNTREGIQIQGGTGTVINAGTVMGFGDGIYLRNSGDVTNQSGGMITGRLDGIQIDRGGSVTNEETAVITGTNNFGILIRTGVGTVDNAGTIDARREAVILTGGGTVTNTATGTIDSATREGIQIQGGTGTVVNAGTVMGFGDGIYLRNSGDVTNQSGGMITGRLDGVQIDRGGTVANEENAVITATNNFGIRIQSGAGTVNNAGTIDARQEGVFLGRGGAVTNTATGTIDSATREGVQISGAAGTVDNMGAITAGAIGVFLDRGGSLTNYDGATITAGTTGTRIDNGGTLINMSGGSIVGNGGNGAQMQNGGTVSNEAGATISGTNIGVFVTGGAGMVTNGGDITGTRFGAILNNGGTITNAEGATIVGNIFEGIRINSGVTNIVNAGTISGGGATAIRFGNSSDSLTLQTGSIINGNVNGRGGTDRLFLEGTGTEDSAFQSFEALTMQGTDWTLSGTSGFNSALISSGILRITGTLNSPVTIDPAGTLGGNGTIGGNVINNGLISPGTGTATLTINNNYTNAAGATYDVDIAPSGATDLLDVGGTATLNGGAVNVTATPGTYPAGSIFTIIDAGSVAGTFDGVTTASAFVTPMISYTATTVDLTVTVLPFTAFAGTPNQIAVAEFLDATAPTATGDYSTVVNELFNLSPATYRSSLNLISGDVHATTTDLSIQTHDQFNAMIEARQNTYWNEGRSTSGDSIASRQESDLNAFANNMSQTTDDGGFWVQGYYIDGDVDGNGNAAGSDYDIVGLVGGIDAQVSANLLIGAAVGTAQANADFAARNGASTQIDTFQAGAYASYFDGAVDLDAIVGYAVQDISSDRPISFGGINRVATGSYDGRLLSAYGKAGYVIPAATNTYVEPLVSLRYSYLETDSFTETGAGSLNLTANGMSRDSLRSSVGAQITFDDWFAIDKRVTSRLHALWSHEFLDDNPTFNASLSGAVGGQTFTIAGVDAGRNSADLGGSVTFDIAEQVSLFAGYQTNLSTDGLSHGLQGGVRITW